MSDGGNTGGCLCGAVRYRVEAELREIHACHCSQCRRVSGHYAAFSACANEALVFEKNDGLAWYESSPGTRRGFCRKCGATLFWDDSSRSHIAVAAGSLDEPTGLTLAGHIFVADKGDYYQIADGLPQEQGWMK